MKRAEVLWTSTQLMSAEHFVLAGDDTGARLAGTTVIVFEDCPAHLRYDVLVDHEWRTRGAVIDLVGHRSIHVEITTVAGSWRINGEARPDLDDCVDIDLGWTPATNVLPIRRLGLAIGEAAEVTTAWVRFPEMTIVANPQSYERTGEYTWRYRSGPYDFTLDTTAEGIVTRYGDDLWVAKALMLD